MIFNGFRQLGLITLASTASMRSCTPALWLTFLHRCLRDLPGLAILILGFAIDQLGESTLVRRDSSSHRHPSNHAIECARSESVKSDAKGIKL